MATFYRRFQRHLPAVLHSHLLALHRLPARALFRGTKRYCPLCASSLRAFLPHGPERRPDALCPVCFSLERHRAAWLFLEKRTDLFGAGPRRLLHFAPEPAIQARLRRLSTLDYVTADLDNPRADVVVDITAMQFADGGFDAVYCSHVLEHVLDDRRALRELWRVLKPGGWALLLVPVAGEQTDEDATVTDPAERLRRFGQADHVRRYGLDFRDRVQEAGFGVEVVHAGEMVSSVEGRRFGLKLSEPLFFCLKPL